MKITHMVSVENNCWQAGTVNADAQLRDALVLTGQRRQTVRGFGGCFNELGWDALQRLSGADRSAILDDLYGAEGCAFTMGRLPIGANDFSLEWYSCDETDGDYELRDFTIERDKKYTIPFIREALQRQPNLELFASPWSPPTWMKTKKAYNYGTLRKEEAVRKAYAEYFIKFVRAYAEEKIKITQIHVQNEPMADQKFPSCLWSGEEMRDFIRDHLGPAVKESGLPLELWLGTINGPFADFMIPGCSAPFSEFYDQFANTILSDEKARSYLTGVGFQWGGKHVIEQVQNSYPELRYMQTESECGDGENSWQHAEYVFGLMWHYFFHYAESYLYWNIALLEGGISTWGWTQNSLITVDPETCKFTYRPEYYVMKHFSHFVRRGARVLRTRGHWSSNCVAFENPDGQLVLVVASNMNHERVFEFSHDGISFSAAIEPHSLHTFTIGR